MYRSRYIMKTVKGKQPNDIQTKSIYLRRYIVMKMYCVEHSKNDFENAYFTSETQAVRHHVFLKDLMANGEIEEEEIYITVGEMTEDGYSAEEVCYEI